MTEKCVSHQIFSLCFSVLTINVQPQMIRSNSSGGVTLTNSTKLQIHRSTIEGWHMLYEHTTTTKKQFYGFKYILTFVHFLLRM